MKFSAIATDQNGVERRLTVEAPNWEAVERGLTDRKFSAIRRADDGITVVESPAPPAVPVLAPPPAVANLVDAPAVHTGIPATQVVQTATFVASILAVWGLLYIVAIDVISGVFAASSLIWYAKSIVWTGACIFLLMKPELLARFVPKCHITMALLIPMACGIYFALDAVSGILSNLILLCKSLSETEGMHANSSGSYFRYVVLGAFQVGLGLLIMHKAEPLAKLAKLAK